MPESFLRTLLNAGVLASDAQTLDQNYSVEPEFLEGLETIARALALNEPLGLLKPVGEPWGTFHGYMIHASDMQQAFMNALGTLSPALQVAISGAVSTRMSQVQQFQQQFQVDGKKRRKTKEYIQVLTNLGYKFRYNMCTHNLEVNDRPITDPLAAEIRAKVRDVGVDQVNVVEDAYLAHAWQQRYHPIRDYLHNLKYLGKDTISELAGFFTDKDGVFPVFLKRFVVGAIARVFASEQNRMLVLNGRQGLGKDHFAKWLGSPMPEYVFEGHIDPDDKDSRLRLLSTWIWDVSELGSTTRRSDREALKAFLSTTTVRERRPYGHFDIQGPAISSFVGSINDEGGFLSDPTGHRRFMVVQLTDIDWAYTRVDVDQVWAQAYDLYFAGEPWTLQGDELAKANEINEQYQLHDMAEMAIIQYFKIDPSERSWFLSTLEIVQYLESKNIRFSNNRAASMEVSSALTKLGLEKYTKRVRGQLVRGWNGIAII